MSNVERELDQLQPRSDGNPPSRVGAPDKAAKFTAKPAASTETAARCYSRYCRWSTPQTLRLLRLIPPLQELLGLGRRLRRSWFVTAPRLPLQRSRGVEPGTSRPGVDVGSLFSLVKDNGATAPPALVRGALGAVPITHLEPAVVHQEYTRLPLNGPRPEVGATHGHRGERR
jgi:hypothetical protein